MCQICIHACSAFYSLSVCLSQDNMILFEFIIIFDFFFFCFFLARGLDEKMYCTNSITFINKTFVRSFCLSLPRLCLCGSVTVSPCPPVPLFLSVSVCLLVPFHSFLPLCKSVNALVRLSVCLSVCLSIMSLSLSPLVFSCHCN